MVSRMVKKDLEMGIIWDVCGSHPVSGLHAALLTVNPTVEAGVSHFSLLH